MLVRDECEITPAEFRRVSELVHRHCGISLNDGKMSLVQARLAKRLRAGRFGTVTAYLDHVQADPGGSEFTELIDAISTNLTSFFREDDHFRYLADHGVPGMLARRRGAAGGARVRAWSAACSTGEEPYSLAMTLLDALGPKAGSVDLKILATDICTRVLRTAEAGVYDEARVRSVPPDKRARYLRPERQGGRAAFKVVPEVRDAIRFRHLNLTGAWPFAGPFQFIFCRNVMIYFDKPTQERLVGRFYDCLEPGGLLFTGHSESLTGVAHRFRYVQPTIYARP
ncbi:MAG: protein-glutamate O-methyltransferase CheR [Phycisphaerales bacterium]|nr:protein-glutamate O-methyltransferase CheR [Phycisphaerales bacterium]